MFVDGSGSQLLENHFHFFSFLVDDDGVEVAHLQADAAAHAQVRVNEMRLPPFTSDRADWAVAGAHGTAGAGRFDNIVFDQRFADLGRAALFEDMSFVFVAEQVQCADDRGRCALS